MASREELLAELETLKGGTTSGGRSDLMSELSSLKGSANIPTKGEFEETLQKSTHVNDPMQGLKGIVDNDLTDIRFLLNYMSETSSLDLINTINDLPIVGEMIELGHLDSAGVQTTKDALNVANTILHERLGINDGEIKRDEVGGKFYLQHPIRQKDGSIKTEKFDLNRPNKNPLDVLGDIYAASGETHEYYPIIIGVLGSAFGPQAGAAAAVGTKTVQEAVRKKRVEKITGEKSERTNSLIVGASLPVENFAVGTVVKGGIGMAKAGGSFINNLIKGLGQMTGSDKVVKEVFKKASMTYDKAKLSVAPITDYIGDKLNQAGKVIDDNIDFSVPTLSTESKTEGFFFNLNNKIYSDIEKYQSPGEMRKILNRSTSELSKFAKRVRGNVKVWNSLQQQALDYTKELIGDIKKGIFAKQPSTLDKALSGVKSEVGQSFAEKKATLPGLKKLESLGLQAEATADPAKSYQIINDTIDDFDFKLQSAGDDLAAVSDDLLASSADDIKLGQSVKDDVLQYIEKQKKYFQDQFGQNIKDAKANPVVLSDELSGEVNQIYKDLQKEMEKVIPALRKQDTLLADSLEESLSLGKKVQSSVVLDASGKAYSKETAKQLTDADVIEAFSKLGQINIEGGAYKPGAEGLQNATKAASNALKKARGRLVGLAEGSNLPSLQNRVGLMNEMKAYYDVYDINTVKQFKGSPKQAIDVYKKTVLEDPKKAKAIADTAFENTDARTVYKKAITEGADSPEKAIAQINKNLSTEGTDISESFVLKETGMADEISGKVKQMEGIQGNISELEKGKLAAQEKAGALDVYNKELADVGAQESEVNRLVANLENNLRNKTISPDMYRVKIGEISKKTGIPEANLLNEDFLDEYGGMFRQTQLAKTLQENIANPGRTGTINYTAAELANTGGTDLMTADKIAGISDDIIGDFASGKPGAPGKLAADAISLGVGAGTGSASAANYSRAVGRTPIDMLFENISNSGYKIGEFLNTGAYPAMVAGKGIAPISKLGSAFGASLPDDLSDTFFTNIEEEPDDFDVDLERSRLQGAL